MLHLLYALLKTARSSLRPQRELAPENPTWGAPPIHGELLTLGWQVAQATVSLYMPRLRKPPSQRWRAFLQNHTQDLVSVDFFVVPTATFRVLYVFLVLEHERRLGTEVRYPGPRQDLWGKLCSSRACDGD